MSEQNTAGAGGRPTAIGTRRVAVVAALVGTALLGLTACSGGTTTTAGGTTTGTTAGTTSAARQETTTTAAAAPTTTKSDKAAGTAKLPADLPAGLVLPDSDLIEVSGAAGARVLVFKGDESVAEAYHTALTGKGYMVVGTTTAFTATKSTSTVVVTADGDTVTLTVAGA
ncbi:hypothetical protein [Actinosynnema sp. NPDC020468]|uniref:hypothetical protein n=1 Tax=Actinosynnema sp. NPDC020468 TaxID=3154488 RepID=UPI0033CC083E